MAKCVEVGLKPRIRALRLVLFLKADPVDKSVVYTSYKSNSLALLVSKLLYRWSDSFFFIRPVSGS